ncbi:efflux RND transporter periplasmic adaptor subunit [Dysosmobacter sp.]
MEMQQMQETQAAPEAAAGKPKKKLFTPKGKKSRKRLVIGLAAVILAAAAASRLLGGGAPPVVGSTYQSQTAQRRDLTVSVAGTATLAPADAYHVTTLLSTTVLSAPFEEGDLVEKDALLYTMDSGDARESVSRAAISVQQAKLSCQQAQEAMEPTAPIAGTISEIYVHDGDSVSPGDKLARIITSPDLTIDFLFTYVSPDQFYTGQSATVFVNGLAGTVQGTVTSVSDSTSVTSNGKESCSVRVRIANPGVVSDSFTASAVIGSYSSYGNASINMPASSVAYASGSGTVTGLHKLVGSAVTKGEVLCTIDSESNRTQIENAKLNLQSAQLSASSAQSNLDDYTIKSPIAGTVIEKTFKAGDKADGVTSGDLAVIYDLSYLKMEMNVNELDIGKVAVGQTVEITSNALGGQSFTGVVDKVSINGTTTNGFTTYPVTIVVKDYGDLKPGMNVSAEILCQTVTGALSVPVDAVERGNTVTVPGEGAMAEDGSTVQDASRLEQRAVVIGVSDGEYVQILDGLAEGETILLQSGGEE